MADNNVNYIYDVEVEESELFERLDEVLQEHHGKRGALIPVLQIAQGIFGYLPEHVLKYICLSTCIVI